LTHSRENRTGNAQKAFEIRKRQGRYSRWEIRFESGIPSGDSTERYGGQRRHLPSSETSPVRASRSVPRFGRESGSGNQVRRGLRIFERLKDDRRGREIACDSKKRIVPNKGQTPESEISRRDFPRNFLIPRNGDFIFSKKVLRNKKNGYYIYVPNGEQYPSPFSKMNEAKINEIIVMINKTFADEFAKTIHGENQDGTTYMVIPFSHRMTK